MTKKLHAPSAGHTRDLAETWRRERPDLDPLDYLVPIYLLRIGRIVEGIVDEIWKHAHGLNGADMRVLFALRRAGKPYVRRPNELHRAVLVTSGAMSKQLDRLEQRNLVVRSPDPTDHRGFLIQLTGAGLKLADEALTQLAKDSMLAREAGLSAEELATLKVLCERILVAWEV